MSTFSNRTYDRCMYISEKARVTLQFFSLVFIVLSSWGGVHAYRQITAPASQAVESSYFGTSVPWAYPAKFKENIKLYSLRSKKQVTLRFIICPKKKVILPYLKSACACKN